MNGEKSLTSRIVRFAGAVLLAAVVAVVGGLVIGLATILLLPIWPAVPILVIYAFGGLAIGLLAVIIPTRRTLLVALLISLVPVVLAWPGSRVIAIPMTIERTHVAAAGDSSSHPSYGMLAQMTAGALAGCLIGHTARFARARRT